MSETHPVHILFCQGWKSFHKNVPGNLDDDANLMNYMCFFGKTKWKQGDVTVTTAFEVIQVRTGGTVRRQHSNV